MEELDLLKKDWNKDHYPKVSEDDIYGMLHKNSSSTVKWIFIISLIELSFGLILGLLLSFTKYDADNTKFLKSIGVYTYYEVFITIIYIVVVYFIVKFYLMYKKVSTTDNTKQLMDSILKTRKTVQNYILFNLLTFAFGFIALFSFVFKISSEKISLERTGKIIEISSKGYALTVLFIIIVTVVFTTIVWFFYKLLYGFLLKRLKNNFNELKKIDF